MQYTQDDLDVSNTTIADFDAKIAAAKTSAAKTISIFTRMKNEEIEKNAAIVASIAAQAAATTQSNS